MTSTASPALMVVRANRTSSRVRRTNGADRAGRALRAAAALLLPLAAACERDAAAHAPVAGPGPIVFVDVDTLRADHLGCYGYHRPTSPRLDAFAREAVQFEWAFGQAPNTAPSQSSILTSLYPTSHTRIHGEQALPAGAVTVAEVLRDAGWATAAFVDGGHMSGDFGMGQGFELYDDSGGGIAEIGPKSLAWIREHLDEHGGEPFFLLIHSYDVHAPYDESPRRYNELFLDEIRLPSEDFRDNMTHRMEQQRMSMYTDEPLALSRDEVDYVIATYDGGIRHFDDWFGGFVEDLRDLGVYERATLAVFSDHGDEFQEHASFNHEKLYATVTRIPFLLRSPGLPRGHLVRRTVESIDIVPTVLELAGVPVPRHFQGRSLVPLLRGEELDERLAFGESAYFGDRRVVADGSLRFFWTRRSDQVELYAYRRDRMERLDLATERPEEVERFRRQLADWQARVGAFRASEPELADVDEGTRAQLDALGYTE